MNHQEKSTKSSAEDVDGILGFMDYRSAQERAYDGEKLYFLHQDEIGKEDIGSRINVKTRIEVAVECVSQGAGTKVHGFILGTSTTAKMDQGGDKFMMLCNLNKYERRNSNGRTGLGLYVIFIPAYDGLETYVDEYGCSIIETPEEPVMNIEGNWVSTGSREYLEGQRKALSDLSDWEGLNAQKRKYPMQYKDCFIKEVVEDHFNMDILNNVHNELRLNPPPVFRYDLEWTNGRFSKVKLVENMINGRFSSTQLPHRDYWNQFTEDINGYRPSDTVLYKNVLGIDPFKFDKTEGHKSKAAGVVFRLYDEVIDPEDKPSSEWLTDQFTGVYNNRVATKNDFADDMLKWCCIFGLMAFPEMNVPLINDKFTEWGAQGFLIYKTSDGVTAQNPGTSMTEPVKQNIFGSYMSYINRRGIYEKNIDIIEQCIEIRSPKEMRFYDVFTAGGLALEGVKYLFPILAERNRMSSNEVVTVLEEYEC